MPVKTTIKCRDLAGRGMNNNAPLLKKQPSRLQSLSSANRHLVFFWAGFTLLLHGKVGCNGSLHLCLGYFLKRSLHTQGNEDSDETAGLGLGTQLCAASEMALAAQPSHHQNNNRLNANRPLIFSWARFVCFNPCTISPWELVHIIVIRSSFQ